MSESRSRHTNAAVLEVSDAEDAAFLRPETTEHKPSSPRRQWLGGRKRLWLGLAVVCVLVYWSNVLNVRQRLRSMADASKITLLSAEEREKREKDEAELKRRKAQHAKRVADCDAYRDYGMVSVLQRTPKKFCQRNETTTTALRTEATRPSSPYTVYESGNAGIQSTVFSNLWVDFRQAKVFKPIDSIAQDGHLHDPRFTFPSVNVYCFCDADQNTSSVPRVWDEMLGNFPTNDYYTVCRRTTQEQADVLASGWDTTGAMEDGVDTTYNVTRIATNAIVLARRDDHNPFFQISAALNAWMMMKVVGWKPETTQLVYFDDGFPSPIDALQQAVLSPKHPVVPGHDLLKSVVHFDHVMIAPFEMAGPMMRHLDNNEPCGLNKMISDFRKHALQQMNVSLIKQDPTTCLVTIITRRPYDGRMVQRKWLNEDHVLAEMIRNYSQPGVYKHGTCTFQSVDFVHLSLAEQMQLMVESDVVIGMHGAGMVNVLWTRPETLVVEIFPKKRFRWGYRNLCQFVGCRWHQFRDGEDISTGKTANANDKIIPYDEWQRFFDPLFQGLLKGLEGRVDYELQQLRVAQHKPRRVMRPYWIAGAFMLGLMSVVLIYVFIVFRARRSFRPSLKTTT
ncbi:hypothetical protein Poli38472_010844 [Pythium oligandrum]|uniref:Glycosyltransferase 61 catalytic domain-containing protein n=1 Tax=Pythium oligandrum TaxID=41045 RepID=A0A8K1CFA2_PYTOL|nr:hypothetical protein Poli38472_010844 [Pythium oligandrum]|eukprot:TMW61781.1 hypothetical protein Poli38472_010844 [Pythium oligandrum]